MQAITVAGRRIEFRFVDGLDASPVIVFLHEGLGSTGLWRDFPDRLCARTGARGLVYSRYGNGFSEPLAQARSAEYMHVEARVTLLALLDALHIGRPILFGHSDGASIALIFAASHPARVRALVVEAPHVFVEPISLASIAKIGERYREGTLRERMRAHHADVDRTFFGWNDIWLAPEFAAWNITGMLAKITAPALSLQGKADEYGTAAQLVEIAKLSHGTVDSMMLDGCAHAPHRDRAALVESLVAAWIAEKVVPQ